MLASVLAGRLEALYVVGANPLKGKDPAEYRGKSFLVVQDLFLHETGAGGRCGSARRQRLREVRHGHQYLRRAPAAAQGDGG